MCIDELEDWRRSQQAVPSPEDRVRAIREREQQATKGPWAKIGVSSERDPGCGISSQIGDGTSFRVANTDIDDLDCAAENNNAEFIAHARADIPYLISLVEELKGQVADAHAGLLIHERLLLAISRSGGAIKCWQKEFQASWAIRGRVSSNVKSLVERATAAEAEAEKAKRELGVMREALKKIEIITRSENHSPCRSGGIDDEGVCPNTCVCEMAQIVKLISAALTPEPATKAEVQP